ncbi:MAG TPA: molecular chaperone DnaK [Candidatus Pacearchaeota archaeon]|nr:molecular chaperone DnaK [Candidatus Pacearchaeota archaeon]
MSKSIGIDLGTTMSTAATIINGEPKALENREGEVVTPSVVALSKNNERIIGVLAKRQAVTNPLNTIHSVKRFIGRKYSDPEVQAELKKLSYQTREGANQGVEIKMGDKWYTPIEISAMVLQKIKADAKEKIGEEITEAVITCPANFDDSQRKATMAAGEIAGLKVLKIINEPTAAALAYGLGKKGNEKVLVYDYGGGTFDVTILNVAPNAVEVIATGGEPHLGGNDFDQAIMDWIIFQFKKDEGIDLSKDSLALQRIKEASEKAKIELSSSTETEINLPFISSNTEGPKHLLYKINRAKFDELTNELVQRAINRVDATIKEAINKKDEPRLNNKEEINEVVLVGGSTLIPSIRESVKKYFGKEPNKSLNPAEVVALGAAIQAEIISASNEGRTTQGDIKSVLLLDVLPLSLGIETMGAVATKMIEKNTTIPTSKTQIFSTAMDNQPSVEINVLQGERAMAQDNRSLGRFILDGIPPAPRGIPQIEVTFDIDSNGTLTVTAKDKGSNKIQKITVQGSSGLSKEEIERMKNEAQMHEAEDQKKKDLVENKNHAEMLIYQTEKTLNENKDKISQDLIASINAKIDALKKSKDSDDLDDLKAKISDLSNEIQKIGEQIYKTQQEQQPNQEQNQQEKKDNNQNPEAQEGEFTDK